MAAKHWGATGAEEAEEKLYSRGSSQLHERRLGPPCERRPDRDGVIPRRVKQANVADARVFGEHSQERANPAVLLAEESFFERGPLGEEILPTVKAALRDQAEEFEEPTFVVVRLRVCQRADVLEIARSLVGG